jgi:hypothetical protein
MTRSVAELVEGLRDALPEITANNWTFSQQFLLKRLIREAAAALERLEASLKDAARLVAISDAARVELEAENAALRQYLKEAQRSPCYMPDTWQVGVHQILGDYGEDVRTEVIRAAIEAARGKE